MPTYDSVKRCKSAYLNVFGTTRANIDPLVQFKQVLSVPLAT